MVDRSLAAAPVPERRVAPVAGPEERTPAERAGRAEGADALRRADAPERMIVRLTMAETQAAEGSADRLAAGLEAVREQLAALRELVIAGRLEPRVVPEAVSVALPEAVARLERTIRAVVAPAVPPAPVAVEETGAAPPVPVPVPAPVDAPVPAAAPPDTSLAPVDVDTRLAPSSRDSALVPVEIDTGLAPPTLDTALVPAESAALVPAGLDVALAPASVGTALVPVELDVALAVAAEVPAARSAIRSAALLVTTDPEVVPALEAPPGDGVPVVLQHRPFAGPPAPTTLLLPALQGESQALLVGEGNGLLHVDLAVLEPEALGLQEVVGAPTPQALEVVDRAIEAVDRVAADVGRVRQEVELAAERAVLGAVPPEAATAQAVAAVTDEVRASIALQAVAALMASVAGLDRRHVERLIIDAPAHATAARRPAPVQILAMGAMATRT